MVDGDLKLFGNFGTTLASGFQPYGHANYARRRVTGGFYYRHPHTRSGVFRGSVVDGLPTLLVGDRLWAETGVPGAGGCPVVPVAGSRPDRAALAAVEADPDLDSDGSQVWFRITATAVGRMREKTPHARSEPLGSTPSSHGCRRNCRAERTTTLYQRSSDNLRSGGKLSRIHWRLWYCVARLLRWAGYRGRPPGGELTGCS